MNAETRILKKQIAAAKATLARHTANLKFAVLPPAQKRIAIARDVLAMLVLPKGKRPRIDSTYMDVNVRDEAFTQETLCTNPSACTVCGIGSLMLAHFRMFDNVPRVEDVEMLMFADIADRLRGYFSKKQLACIEAAFEGKIMSLDDYYILTPKLREALNTWNDYVHRNPTQRLRKIMENLIENGGTFDIYQTPGK
jgi:hypothetical protein